MTSEGLKGVDDAEIEALRSRLAASKLAHEIATVDAAERRRAKREVELWHAPFIRALRSAAFFLTHTALAAVFIVLLTGLNILLEWAGAPKLLHRVDLAYVFDAMDLTILIVFGIFGTVQAVEVFKE